MLDHHPSRRPGGHDLDLELARSLVETKELKLRRAIQLVSEAQRELIKARRELKRAERRHGLSPTRLLDDADPRKTG